MKILPRNLRLLLFVISLTLSLAISASPQRSQKARTSPYFPAAGEKWERKKAEEVGMDASKLDAAIEYAKQQKEPKSVAEVIAARQRQESHPEIIGPTKERGEINGLVLRHGYIVAEFGDTDRADMTFSVSKSFLSAVAGLAFDRHMIRNLGEPVGTYVKDGGFDSAHNAKITWQHLLQQTSEWEGWLWEKPSTIDEPKGHVLAEPGTFWNYGLLLIALVFVFLSRRAK